MKLVKLVFFPRGDCNLSTGARKGGRRFCTKRNSPVPTDKYLRVGSNEGAVKGVEISLHASKWEWLVR